jgi:dienelactone hydrolase
MMEVSDACDKCIVVTSLAVAVLLLCEQNLPAAVLQYFADCWLIAVLLEAPVPLYRVSSLLKIFWRTAILYCFQIISTIYCSFLVFSFVQSNPSVSILLIVGSFTSAIAIYIYPVPILKDLPGRFKSIGTISFDLPVENCSSPQETRCYQCWFPIDVQDSCWFKGRSLRWTSGHEKAQVDESKVLLRFTATSNNIPSFFLRHLSLAKSNVLYQDSFKNLVKEPNQSPFPIAIYSHGLYGWRQIHHYCCEALASFGFVVVAMDHHPDSMVSRWTPRDPTSPDISPSPQWSSIFGSKLKLFQSSPFAFANSGKDDEREFYSKGLERRVDDIKRLITFIEMGGIYQRFPELPANCLDSDNLFTWGHSYGGGTVAALSCQDTRVRAVVTLDGWFYPIPDELRHMGSQGASVLNLSSELWKYGAVRQFLLLFNHRFLKDIYSSPKPNF